MGAVVKNSTPAELHHRFSDIPTWIRDADAVFHLENGRVEKCVSCFSPGSPCVGWFGRWESCWSRSVIGCRRYLHTICKNDGGHPLCRSVRVLQMRIYTCTMFTCSKLTIQAMIGLVCWDTDDFPVLLSHQRLQSLVVFRKLIIIQSN